MRAVPTSTYPPQETNAKGEVHEDIAYFSYDRSTKTFKMRHFQVEGFVTEYVATSTGASEVVFNSESLENIPAGWRARETWRITGADSFVEVFELAEPGKDFTVYSETRLTRRRDVGQKVDAPFPNGQTVDAEPRDPEITISLEELRKLSAARRDHRGRSRRSKPSPPLTLQARSRIPLGTVGRSAERLRRLGKPVVTYCS